MTETITTAAKRSLDEPDEVIDFGKGRVHVVSLNGISFDRSVFEPGWRWSEHVKPIAQTESCEFPHRFVVTEGSMHIRMDDGVELEAGPGDAVVIGPGHDAWVSSDVPCVVWGIDGEDLDFGKPSR
ncbi:MAG: cupin domain-containing protein [Acidimicrobiia bacterium]